MGRCQIFTGTKFSAGFVYAKVPAVSRFKFHFQHKTKHVRQGLPRMCQFYNCDFILNVGFEIDYKVSRVTNYLSRTLKIEI